LVKGDEVHAIPLQARCVRWAGEWTRLRMRNFREQCCDCSLIHRLDFRIVDGAFGSPAPRRPRHRPRGVGSGLPRRNDALGIDHDAPLSGARLPIRKMG
jgi:hypothetical protein